VSSTAAVRALGVVLAILLSGAVVASAAAQPSGAGPGNSPSAKLCQKGGWQNVVGSDGTTFANAGSCTSYAAKGGALVPKPADTPRERFLNLCEAAGGTFTEGPTFWRCDSPAGLTEATFTALSAPCVEADRVALRFPFVPPYAWVVCTDLPDLPPPPPVVP
jgi:hypothetical protein